jgi:hypothetical protein
MKWPTRVARTPGLVRLGPTDVDLSYPARSLSPFAEKYKGWTMPSLLQRLVYSRNDFTSP